MQKTTVIIEKLQIEKEDLLNFSIEVDKKAGDIYAVFQIKTGIQETQIKIELDKLSESVARLRAGTEGPNPIDMPPAGYDNSIRKLLAAFDNTEWET